MKRTVRRPVWPAPPPSTPAAQKKPDTMTRIRLALLEEYATSGERRGYDPYDTSTVDQDLWRYAGRRK